MARALRAGAFAAALVLSASSCVRLSYNRETVHVPIEDARLAELFPGDGLERCLTVLGAPLTVRELGGGKSALVYGWLDQKGWGVNVSTPVADNVSASLDYDRVDSRARGFLLLFDADQRLEIARRGLLRDLLLELPRPRPAFDATWNEAQ